MFEHEQKPEPKPKNEPRTQAQPLAGAPLPPRPEDKPAEEPATGLTDPRFTIPGPGSPN